MNAFMGIAWILFVIALGIVLEDNNIHIDGSVVVVFIIGSILRIIGEIKEGRKFGDMMDYMDFVDKEYNSLAGKDIPAHISAVHDSLNAYKQSNARLEERFSQVENQMRLMRTRFGWTRNVNPPAHTRDVL